MSEIFKIKKEEENLKILLKDVKKRKKLIYQNEMNKRIELFNIKDFI